MVALLSLKDMALTEVIQMAVKYICKTCNSEDVCVDAVASFDVVSQQWQLQSTYDQAYCLDCDSETDIKEVEL